MLLLSRVGGGGIHIAQAVQREREGEPEGEKGNKRWREEGRVGWLAAAYIIGADGWREGESGIPGKDDGGEDGRWGFFMCGRPEGGREGSGAVHEGNAAEGLRI